ncbi:diphosphomevalonate decarboxylase [Candidatus Woesearchaeota archaeon]|nr:diphosphomevalonate decarboxylase [Candidatus Woesearchaeota archaeon]|tara:strand:+ start:1631 stop:2620 length:990 start_codon:yes stop_codon:yes gene_type:complete
MIRTATVEANSNIALIKYWGKRDKKLNLPMNSSFSWTLDDQVKTTTQVSFSEDYKEDELYLDGKKQEGKKAEKVSKHLDLIRDMAETNLKARVVSSNSFPMGTGIASSASGFAALTAAACKALDLNLDYQALSALARRGSGSAARSFYSGFVEWKRGEKPDGSDSYGIQYKDGSYWSELRDIIVIVEQSEKSVSSRDGMNLTVETSSLYKERVKRIDEKIERIKRSIDNKDKESLFQIIMEDSDDLHSTMLDTTPSLDYLNETSQRIKAYVKQFNEGSIKAGYTFDAGPNAHIITTSDQVDDIVNALEKIEGIKRVIVSGYGEGIKIKR